MCKPCQLTLFQLNEVINDYLNGSPPEWMSDFIRELDFIYQEDLRVRGYFNVASEVVEIFVIDKEPSVKIDDVEEFHNTHIAQRRIIEVLEWAKIVERKGDRLYPGELTIKFISLRREERYLTDEEIQKVIFEIRGLLTVALTKALLEMNVYVPRGALSIFNMLSRQILASYGQDSVDPKIYKLNQDITFGMIPKRQRNHIKRRMIGLSGGGTRLIEDIDDEGNLVLKPKVVRYLQRIRERIRERQRTVTY